MSLLGIAVLVPSVMLAHSVWSDGEALRREIEGMAPVRSVQKVVQLTQQHRGLSALVLGGNEAGATARHAKGAEVSQALVAATAAVHAGGLDSDTAQNWKKIVAEWTALEADVSQKKLNARESMGRHTALITQMTRTIELAADQYGLVFDWDPSDYYLIIASTRDALQVTELSGVLRGTGAAMLANPDAVTIAQRAEMASLANLLAERVERVVFGLERAMAHRVDKTQALTQAADSLRDQSRLVASVVSETLVKPQTLEPRGKEYFDQMTRAIDTMYVAINQLQDELAASFEARRRAQLVLLIVGCTGVTVLFAMSLGVALHTGKWLRSRLGAEPDELHQAVSRVASGDLATPVAVRSDDSSSVLAAISRMQRALSELVGQVRDNAGQVSTASSEIAQGNQDLSSRTEHQAAALQQTVASMDQLRNTISHSADNARQASQLASQASEVAGRGGASVSQLAESMSRIQESSRRINDIIGTIDSIAFQTNILALNAAVEAARAGEQGRGFAVVASEVRSLAQRSSAAAREIRGLIVDSVERVDEGSRQGNQVAVTMQEVVTSIQRVSDLISEVSAAAQEQNNGVTQIATRVQQMDEATQRNAALVEQSAAAAESLRQQAGTLQGAVSRFKTIA
jgi:methyl-accepting chemotaxis protein